MNGKTVNGAPLYVALARRQSDRSKNNPGESASIVRNFADDECNNESVWSDVQKSMSSDFETQETMSIQKHTSAVQEEWTIASNIF